MRLAVIPTPEGFTTRAVGLDYGAVMMVAAARGVDTALLADVLPAVEAAILGEGEGREEGLETD